MPATRTRLTADERIAELKAEIERIKAREVQQKVKKDPALRHISAAARAVDKAASSTQDKATRQALLVEAMGGEGIGEQQVRVAADVLNDSGHLDAGKCLGKGTVTARITNEGISTLLTADMPEYEELKMQCVPLLVNKGIERAKVLAERIVQSAIFANHISEELQERGYVKLSGEIGRYREFACNEVRPRRLVATLK